MAEERDDWTLSQWRNRAEWVERDLSQERQEHATERKVLTEERDMLRYAVKGICADRLSLSVHIDPSMIAGTKDVWDLAQFLVRHHATRAAHEVELKLGERYEVLQALDEARHHIFYLENHAASRGLAFTPYAMRAKIFR